MGGRGLAVRKARAKAEARVVWLNGPQTQFGRSMAKRISRSACARARRKSTNASCARHVILTTLLPLRGARLPVAGLCSGLHTPAPSAGRWPQRWPRQLEPLSRPPGRQGAQQRQTCCVYRVCVRRLPLALSPPLSLSLSMTMTMTSRRRSHARTHTHAHAQMGGPRERQQAGRQTDRRASKQASKQAAKHPQSNPVRDLAQTAGWMAGASPPAAVSAHSARATLARWHRLPRLPFAICVRGCRLPAKSSCGRLALPSRPIRRRPSTVALVCVQKAQGDPTTSSATQHRHPHRPLIVPRPPAGTCVHAHWLAFALALRGCEHRCAQEVRWLWLHGTLRALRAVSHTAGRGPVQCVKIVCLQRSCSSCSSCSTSPHSPRLASPPPPSHRIASHVASRPPEPFCLRHCP